MSLPCSTLEEFLWLVIELNCDYILIHLLLQKCLYDRFNNFCFLLILLWLYLQLTSCYLSMAIICADFTLTLRIVDHSRASAISVTFFADNTALLPCVRSSGDVISLHNVVVRLKLNTLLKCTICYIPWNLYIMSLKLRWIIVWRSSHFLTRNCICILFFNVFHSADNNAPWRILRHI